MKHFEDLWNACEFSFQNINDDTVSQIIDELMIKLNLYKTIDLKTEIPNEERQKIKSRTFGEILYTLTNLSLKDNINVFETLKIALQIRQHSQ